MLGAALSGQKKYSDAKGVLLSGFDGMMRRASTIPAGDRPLLHEAAQRVIRLYREWGKPDSAALWAEKIEVIQPAR